MNALASIRKAVRRSEGIGCAEAENLMSPFIDSMASGDEVPRLEAHVSVCAPCQRQLQSYISVKNLLLSADESEVPVDLALRTRVRLSRDRNTNYLLRLETKFSNVVGPIALPAIAGVFFLHNPARQSGRAGSHRGRQQRPGGSLALPAR